MSHLMLHELESNAPSLSEGQNDEKPGFEKFGKLSWRVLQARYEEDYGIDVEIGAVERERRAKREGARMAIEQRAEYRRQHPRFGKVV